MVKRLLKSWSFQLCLRVSFLSRISPLKGRVWSFRCKLVLKVLRKLNKYFLRLKTLNSRLRLIRMRLWCLWSKTFPSKSKWFMAVKTLHCWLVLPELLIKASKKSVPSLIHRKTKVKAKIIKSHKNKSNKVNKKIKVKNNQIKVKKIKLKKN